MHQNLKAQPPITILVPLGPEMTATSLGGVAARMGRRQLHVDLSVLSRREDSDDILLERFPLLLPYPDFFLIIAGHISCTVTRGRSDQARAPHCGTGTGLDRLPRFCLQVKPT